LTQEKLEKIAIDKMGATQIGAMNATQIQNLSADALQKISAAGMQGWTPAQIKLLDATQMEKLSAEQMCMELRLLRDPEHAQAAFSRAVARSGYRPWPSDTCRDATASDQRNP
jgi:hypothetical protein